MYYDVYELFLWRIKCIMPLFIYNHERFHSITEMAKSYVAKSTGPPGSIDLVFFFFFDRLSWGGCILFSFLFNVYFTSILLFVAKSFKKLLLQRLGGKGVACQRCFWPFTKSHTYRLVEYFTLTETDGGS